MPNMITEPSTTPKPRHRWPQFSLRTLMVFVLAISVPLGWFGMKVKQARQEEAAVEAVEAVTWGTVTVTYDYEVDCKVGPYVFRRLNPEPPGPHWVRNLLGDYWFMHVVEVNLANMEFTDAGLEHLKGMTHLERLVLRGTQVTDAGLAHLRGLTRLEQLDLGGTQVTDAGLDHLRALPQLRELNLTGTKVTDVGLEHLNDLPELQILYPRWNHDVTDAGPVYLQGLTLLQQLWLNDTQVTDASVNELKKAMPNLKIKR
jgi:hypothetical protein